MGVGGLHVHAGVSARCDELSSWRSSPEGHDVELRSDRRHKKAVGFVLVLRAQEPQALDP